MANLSQVSTAENGLNRIEEDGAELLKLYKKDLVSKLRDYDVMQMVRGVKPKIDTTRAEIFFEGLLDDIFFMRENLIALLEDGEDE